MRKLLILSTMSWLDLWSGTSTYVDSTYLSLISEPTEMKWTLAGRLQEVGGKLHLNRATHQVVMETSKLPWLQILHRKRPPFKFGSLQISWQKKKGAQQYQGSYPGNRGLHLKCSSRNCFRLSWFGQKWPGNWYLKILQNLSLSLVRRTARLYLMFVAGLAHQGTRGAPVRLLINQIYT